MKKITAIMMIAVMMLVSLAGCGKGNKTIDAKALSNSLLQDISYKDTLSEIGLDSARAIYAVDDAEVVESYIYVSSGATAEEIAVFTCSNSKSADVVEAAFQTRVEDQKIGFENYVPAELDKLDKAVIEKVGNSVILSISDDPEGAKGIIEKAAK